MAATDFVPVFDALRGVLQKRVKQLNVQKDSAEYYCLETRKPSPFPQHKGKPMFFAAVRMGKAYVSFHLLPLYMNPALAKQVPPALKKRMQGKACFNFKTVPDRELLRDLDGLNVAAVKDWKARGWL
jgi:hypothetical protein